MGAATGLSQITGTPERQMRDMRGATTVAVPTGRHTAMTVHLTSCCGTPRKELPRTDSCTHHVREIRRERTYLECTGHTTCDAQSRIGAASCAVFPACCAADFFCSLPTLRDRCRHHSPASPRRRMNAATVRALSRVLPFHPVFQQFANKAPLNEIFTGLMATHPAG